jgi:hypothetical protein
LKCCDEGTVAVKDNYGCAIVSGHVPTYHAILLASKSSGAAFVVPDEPATWLPDVHPLALEVR